jgi:hypothetical protein
MSAGSGQPPPVVGIAQIRRSACSAGRLCRVRLPLPGGGEARGSSRRSCASRPTRQRTDRRAARFQCLAKQPRGLDAGWRLLLGESGSSVPPPPRRTSTPAYDATRPPARQDRPRPRVGRRLRGAARALQGALRRPSGGSLKIKNFAPVSAHNVRFGPGARGIPRASSHRRGR